MMLAGVHASSGIVRPHLLEQWELSQQSYKTII